MRPEPLLSSSPPLSALARWRYDPIADPWLKALKHSARSGETARTWRCGFCDHRGIVDGGVLWRWFALHWWENRR